ncbi:MAG: 4Fe-4S binding protein [Deltaproteobacteria bacterium]|nr:4Fe-4S binding protein [Deltaproteobacteria bacterium]
MSVQVTIREEACRGCQMCVDVCPTKVFTYDDAAAKARVSGVEDCIACLSCVYLCPSMAINEAGYTAVKNFYRDLDFSRRMERFL